MVPTSTYLDSHTEGPPQTLTLTVTFPLLLSPCSNLSFSDRLRSRTVSFRTTSKGRDGRDEPSFLSTRLPLPVFSPEMY